MGYYIHMASITTTTDQLQKMDDVQLKSAYSDLGKAQFIDPQIMAWFRSHRPDIIRNDLLLRQQTGAYVSPIARRFLSKGGR